MAGFKVDEVMVGTHRIVGQDHDRPMHFAITWGAASILDYLNPFSAGFLLAEARGVITADGIVRRADCAGTLRLLYFTGGKIRYELDSTDLEGRAYRYVGEKVNIRPWNLHKSHTTCYGTITELASGEVVSESVVYFPLRELAAFLASVRLVRSPEGGKSEGSRPEGLREACGQEGERRVLSRREASILTAVAGGIIPGKGAGFALGAEDLADKWIPRTEYVVSRMPVLTRMLVKACLHVFNYAWPLRYAGRVTPLTSLDGQARTKILRDVERSGPLGAAGLLLMKVLVFPAFYGLAEVKEAIGYSERFASGATGESKDSRQPSW